MELLQRLAARLGHGHARPPGARRTVRPAAADPLADPALRHMTPHQLADLPFEALRRRARQDNAPPPAAAAADIGCRSRAC